MSAGGPTADTAGSIGIVLVLTVGLGALLVGGIAVAGADEHATPAADEPAIDVDLDEDGAAAVTFTYTFDLTDDDAEAAFEELQTDEEAMETFRDRFESRLNDVAADASAETDRDMSISEVTLEAERDDDTGVVTVSLHWSGLAATENDRLVVTEPFASGFEPDRPLYVTFPADYTVAEQTPEPDRDGERHLVWDAGADLTDFEAVGVLAEAVDDADDETSDDDANGETNDDDPNSKTNDDDANGDDTAGADDGDVHEDDSDDDGPGFGVLTAGIALLTFALFATRRVRR